MFHNPFQEVGEGGGGGGYILNSIFFKKMENGQYSPFDTTQEVAQVSYTA